MNISKALASGQPAPVDEVPAGSFGFGLVHTFSDKGSANVKAACLGADGAHVFTATQGGGIKRWSLTTGSSDVIIPASAFPDPIHTLAVLGRALWVCTGTSNAGTVAVYDLDTLELTGKSFAAHKGEVVCMAAGPGGRYMITGGVDFQVKTWSPHGAQIHSSGHHSKQVEAILVTPLGEGGSGSGGGGKVWTCGADGNVCCWEDAAGSGTFEASKVQVISMPGGKSAKSLCLAGGHVWAGCEGGQVVVIDAKSGAVKKTLKAHSDTVDAVCAVGDQVWSGSRDKAIMAHDAACLETSFSLGDQGSGVKEMLAGGWFVWTFNMKGAKVYTAEGVWRKEAKKAADALSKLKALRKELTEKVEAEKRRSHDLEVQLHAKDGELSTAAQRTSELETELQAGASERADLAAQAQRDAEAAGAREAVLRGGLSGEAAAAAAALEAAHAESKRLAGELSAAQVALRAEKEAAEKLRAAEAEAGEKLRAAEAEAAEKLRAAAGDAGHAAARLAELSGAHEKALANAAALEKGLAQAKAAAEKTEAAAQKTEAGLAAHTSEVEKERAAAKAAAGEASRHKEAAEKAEVAAAKVVAELAARDAELAQLRASLGATAAEASARESEVSTHKTAAEKAEAAAKKMAAELAARNAEAAKQKAAAERVAAELATLRGQHEGAVGEAAKLTAAVEKAAGEAAKHKGVAEKAAAALAARDAELAQAKAAAEKLRGDRDDAVGAAAGALEAGRLEAGKLRAQLEEAGVKLEEARAKLALEGAATSSAEARAGAAETCARAGAAALAAQAEEAGAKARALQALADEATSKARSATAERDEAAARARSAAAERDDVAARVRALQGQVDEEQARTCAAVARADEQEGRARTAAARAEEAEGRADDEARRASAAQARTAALAAEFGVARAERESLTRELARAERRGARAQDELSRGRGAGLAAGPRELPLQSTFPVYPASPSSASPQHAQLPNIIVNIPGLGELRQERSAPLGHGDDDWGEARGDPRARRASWDAGTTLAAALPTPHENFRGSRKLVPHPWADTETTGRASAGAGALRESVELVSGRAAELRQLLEKERGRGAAERQALQDALTSLQRELSEAVEERYQLQLALRSTVKDAEGAVGQRGDPPEDSSGAQPAGEAQAPPADGVKRGARRKLLADRDAGDGDGGDSAGRPGSAAGAGAASASPPLRRPASGKDPALSLLEGALRQATEDYRMLLGEVALIKTEAADHKATAHCTCDERNRLASAAFEAGVDRDRMAASLHEALAEKDRLAAALRDADKVYYAELDRLTGALGGVEAAFAEARAEVAHLERALADCRADLAGCTCGRGGGGDGNNATTTQLSTLHNSIKRRLSEARQADEAFGRQDSLPMSRERANESLTFGHQLAVVQHSESISFGPVRMLPGPLQQCQQPHQHTPLLPQPLLGPPPPPHVHVARPAPHLPTTRAALPPPPWEAADQVPGSSSNTTPGRRPKGLAPAGSPLPPAHERPAAGRPSAQQQGERAPGPGGGGAGPPGGVQQVEVVARALSAGAGASGGEGGGGRKPELARPLPPGGFL